MNIVAQNIRYRQSVVLFFLKNGVERTLRHFSVSRATLFRWRKRYDGTPESLKPKSRRPHHHPSEHTPAEIKLISDMRRRNPHDGLVHFWAKLTRRGYSRSVTGLWRVMKRLGTLPVKLPNPKYVPQPYEQMLYPGQRVQVDVKIVPVSCIAGDAKLLGERFYQFTAIDEYSRFRYLAAFKDESSFSAAQFVRQLVKVFPFPIECIQTDNGSEFSCRFTSKKDKPTLFQKTLQELGIRHKLIKPFTPRHNGKVERSHRKDNEGFYSCHSFLSFADFKQQLYVWNRNYNRFPMKPLRWHTPKDYVDDYVRDGVLHQP